VTIDKIEKRRERKGVREITYKMTNTFDNVVAAMYDLNMGIGTRREEIIRHVQNNNPSTSTDNINEAIKHGLNAGIIVQLFGPNHIIAIRKVVMPIIKVLSTSSESKSVSSVIELVINDYTDTDTYTFHTDSVSYIQDVMSKMVIVRYLDVEIHSQSEVYIKLSPDVIAV